MSTTCLALGTLFAQILVKGLMRSVTATKAEALSSALLRQGCRVQQLLLTPHLQYSCHSVLALQLVEEIILITEAESGQRCLVQYILSQVTHPEQASTCCKSASVDL